MDSFQREKLQRRKPIIYGKLKNKCCEKIIVVFRKIICILKNSCIRKQKYYKWIMKTKNIFKDNFKRNFKISICFKSTNRSDNLFMTILWYAGENVLDLGILVAWKFCFIIIGFENKHVYTNKRKLLQPMCLSVYCN